MPPWSVCSVGVCFCGEGRVTAAVNPSLGYKWFVTSHSLAMSMQRAKQRVAFCLSKHTFITRRRLADRAGSNLHKNRVFHRGEGNSCSQWNRDDGGKSKSSAQFCAKQTWWANGKGEVRHKVGSKQLTSRFIFTSSCLVLQRSNNDQIGYYELAENLIRNH